MNQAIITPVLFLPDPTFRGFFALLLSKYLRLPNPKKLSFLRSACPTLKISGADLKAMEKLFRLRNELIHSSPEYDEPRDPAPVFEWMEQQGITNYDVNELVIPTIPVLTYLGAGREIVEETEKGYTIAQMLVERVMKAVLAMVNTSQTAVNSLAPNDALNPTVHRVTALAKNSKAPRRSARPRHAYGKLTGTSRTGRASTGRPAGPGATPRR